VPRKGGGNRLSHLQTRDAGERRTQAGDLQNESCEARFEREETGDALNSPIVQPGDTGAVTGLEALCPLAPPHRGLHRHEGIRPE